MRALWRSAPLVVTAVLALTLLALPRPFGPVGQVLGWATVVACSVVVLGCAGVSPHLSREEFTRSGLVTIDEMDGVTFEERLRAMYLELGYTVRTTPRSGDYGCDLLLINGAGRKSVVQAKRYSSNVGLEAVQQAVAAMAHYDASNAVVVTNSYFTKAARSLATSNHVELIDRDGLGVMLASQCGEPVAVGGGLLVRLVLAGVRPIGSMVLGLVVGVFWVLGRIVRVVL